jgi:hypothetical protein
MKMRKDFANFVVIISHENRKYIKLNTNGDVQVTTSCSVFKWAKKHVINIF